ncbi:hypothetical protein ACTA71_004656 [Dictyostelium dimigraforme]
MIVPECEKIFKISIIGDSGCGKTCLLLRLTDDTYTESYISTIGVEFKVKTIYVDGIGIKLHIYDSGVSFKNIKPWIGDANRYTLDTCIKYIVGNKSDLEDENVVDINLVKEVAKKENIKFFETSAKNSTNVEECFTELAKDLLKEHKHNEEIKESQKNIDEKNQCLIN